MTVGTGIGAGAMVAVDDSDTSQVALKEAIKFAKGQQTKLRIHHIAVDIYTDYSG